MPIYEYTCSDCSSTFEMLRPMSKANAPAACVRCGSNETARAISLFAAVSRSNGGQARAITGAGGGCGSCSSTSCATCSH